MANVSSVEALVEDDFDYQLSNDQIAELLRQNTESSWASRVEMIELEMSDSIYGNEKPATGRVIFRR